MKRKGQSMGIAVLMGVMIFIVGMILIQFIMPEVTSARAVTSLDCSNSSITDGNKATCLIVDLVVPYGMLIFISLAVGVITARFLI